MITAPPVLVVKKGYDYNPDLIEVQMTWPGQYVTMLTFHRTDFETDRAALIVKEHARMIKRDIELKILEECVWASIPSRSAAEK